MAIAFAQSLFSGAVKNTINTLTLTGSKTLTAGNTIYVAVAGQWGSNATFSCTDNLGNMYSTVVSPTLTNALQVGLLASLTTAGGSLTSITVSTVNNYTAIAAIAAEFSGVGSDTPTTGTFPTVTGDNLNAYPGGTTTATTSQTLGHLWVGVFGYRNTVQTITTPYPSTSGVSSTQPVATLATSGAAATSNVGVGFAYFINNAGTSNMLNAQLGASLIAAAAGADVAPAVSHASAESVICGQALRRSYLY